MELVIAKNGRNLRRFIKQSKNKYNYIYFGDKDEGLEKLLKEKLNDRISIYDYPINFRREFFRAYIDLIGQRGVRLNSIYWWASFTASKNRFMSKLLPNLLAYYVVCGRLKENPSENMLLIDPAQRIIPAIKQHCKINSIVCKIINRSFNGYYLKARETAEHCFNFFYFILINWARIFFSKIFFRKHIKRCSQEKEYYVLRTWVYPSSINNNNKFSDAFFGRLPEFLTAKNKKVIILAGIIAGRGNKQYRNTVKRLADCKENFLIIPQEYFLKYSDIVKAAFKTYFNRINFKEKIQFYGLDVTGIVQRELDKDHRRSIRVAVMQEYIIRNLLNYINIHTFTSIYENNPCEKICILSLRKYSPSTKVIGYQHAVVTEASANMFTNREEMSVIPMPDKIITVGNITKATMERNGHYPKNRIQSSCALRHEYIYTLKKKERVRNNIILLALEGVYESYKFVNFVFEALCDNKDYRIKIRTHPERPFEKIKSKLNFNIQLYKNFSISTNNSVKDDLMESDILIYWGSTVSLEALMMGLPVVHVNLDDIINVDPLFDCKYLKWTVKNPEELADVISEIYGLSREDYEDQYSKAKAYVEKYLQKVTDNRLEEFIL